MDNSVFFKFYANLPLRVRKEVILVLEKEKEPITWEIAYKELKIGTELGTFILNKLIELNFLPTE